ncbi:MAG: hypothetical protein EBS53_05050 [Bacteroidetes bacterium]|jgi:hypothetical protein|nr:hypothetical protein [Bacteroidota bacterium]
MKRYTPKQVETDTVKCGRLATPDGMMGTDPLFVYYDTSLDKFTTYPVVNALPKHLYITTIYPRTREQEISQVDEIEKFHRENNPEVYTRRAGA